jgi:hypothetical protein
MCVLIENSLVHPEVEVLLRLIAEFKNKSSQ